MHKLRALEEVSHRVPLAIRQHVRPTLTRSDMAVVAKLRTYVCHLSGTTRYLNQMKCESAAGLRNEEAMVVNQEGV